MKTTTAIGSFLALLGYGICSAAIAQTIGTKIKADVAVASQAYDRHDYATVIDKLLPLERSGRLKISEPLIWLALACEQAKLPPRNRPHTCHKRRVEIMLQAAEMGNPYAMYGASIGLLDTGPGRFGIRLPFAEDQKRVDALMWALLASDLTSDSDLRAKAASRAQQLTRNLQGEWRGRETLAQRAVRQAKTREPELRAQAGNARPNPALPTGKVPAKTSCQLATYVPSSKPRGTQTSIGFIHYAHDPQWAEVPGTLPSSGDASGQCDGYCDDELDSAYVARYCLARTDRHVAFDFIDPVGDFQRLEFDCMTNRYRLLLSGTVIEKNLIGIDTDHPNRNWLHSKYQDLQAFVCR